MRPPILACAVALVPIAWTAVTAQAPPREPILARTGAYVQQFVDDLTNVVAEEQYQQEFRQAAGRQRLTSEFLLVRYPGQEKIYLTFRDVLQVNGTAVGDQQQRLTRLFLQPFESALRRAGEIHRASATYSLARGRLVDPLEAIAFLQDAYQDNFQFTIRGYAPDAGLGVRQVDYEQIVPPGERTSSLLRATARIEESSGRVVKTELRVGTGALMRYTTARFGADPGLRIDVPVELRDVVPVGADEFLGTARYRNFRRFNVRASESVDLPPTPR